MRHRSLKLSKIIINQSQNLFRIAFMVITEMTLDEMNIEIVALICFQMNLL